MKLHLDKPAFETLLLSESEIADIRADILEKDYYVTLILKELADKPDQAFAYFKGGTALYKAIGSIKRFSEDIDLTVSIQDCRNPSQAKKRLERATLDYSCLPINEEDAENFKRKCAITSIYNYESVVNVDREDELNRFLKVKIEATSFTVSEPHEPILIAPLIFDIATDEQKEILNTYDIRPFKIETIKLERIFIDKVFAAEFYFSPEGYFDMAKHLYDLVVLLKNEKIIKVLKDGKMLAYLIGLKRREELDRRGSDLDKKAIGQFNYFQSAMDNEELLKEFSRMQELYVFNEKDIIPISELRSGIGELKNHMHDY